MWVLKFKYQGRKVEALFDTKKDMIEYAMAKDICIKNPRKVHSYLWDEGVEFFETDK